MKHDIIQYVDDINNLIDTNEENLEQLEIYMNKYFKLIETFYNVNKLKINPDKSKLMIICKPIYRSKVAKIKLHTTEYIIEQVDKLKVLGMFFTTGLLTWQI